MIHNPDIIDADSEEVVPAATSIVLDPALQIEVSEDDLLALIDAESAMGDPPPIGSVDFESGASVRFDRSEETF